MKLKAWSYLVKYWEEAIALLFLAEVVRNHIVVVFLGQQGSPVGYKEYYWFIWEKVWYKPEDHDELFLQVTCKSPLHRVHGGKNILICREGDKEGERNQPETYCEIRHHLKKIFPQITLICQVTNSAHTNLTEWIIILAKVWKCQIVIDQDLGRSWNEFINILDRELSVHHFEKRCQLYHYHREDEGGRGDGEEREWCEESKMSNLPRN